MENKLLLFSLFQLIFKINSIETYSLVIIKILKIEI